MNIEIGGKYAVTYPFIKSSYIDWHEDGTPEVESWQPGTRGELVPPDDCEEVADGIGEMILEVISRHKPGKYPERIFYTRKFKDPDGKIFGKGKLHIASVSKFRRLSAGYYYDYRILVDTHETTEER